MSEQQRLLALKRTDLVEQCRARKLPVSGTKDVLVARLLGEVAPKKKPKAKEIQKTESNAALEYAQKQAPVICVERNKGGIFEHFATGFVFKEDTRKVCGRRLDSGDVRNLSLAEVAECTEYGFAVEDECVDMDNAFADTAEERFQLLLSHFRAGVPPPGAVVGEEDFVYSEEDDEKVDFM